MELEHFVPIIWLPQYTILCAELKQETNYCLLSNKNTALNCETNGSIHR